MPIPSDIQIITASSILGLKPSGVETLPSALLPLGLQNKLHAQIPIIEVPALNDLYTNRRDRQTNIINGDALKRFSINLSLAIQGTDVDEKFLLVLGGDCSILIGIMHALKSKGDYGLFFLDAHADFYEPEKSTTGETADMDLAIVTGRGPELLTNISGTKPYVKDENVVHIGQRDMLEAKKYNSQDIRATNMNCFDESLVHHIGVDATISEIERKIQKNRVDGFWIHFDTDVIDDDSNPAVDYRLPGGLSFQECKDVLSSLTTRFPVIGMSVTIFNPSLDKDKSIARKLITLLSEVIHQEG
jgi:arginase